jgi:hypothetical protein
MIVELEFYIYTKIKKLKLLQWTCPKERQK